MIEKGQLKDTVLDDTAEIYKQRQEQTVKQKLSEMTLKEKITYFNNYYRLTAIVVIAIVIAAVYLVYTILTPKPENILYAAVINSAVDDETAEALQADFGQTLGIDPETQEITIDTSFFLGDDNNVSEYTLASQQKLVAYIYAGEIDVIIAPESVFSNYTYLGNFSKLTEQLPTDLCTALTDSFYHSATEDDPASSAYGIYLDGAKIYDNNGELIDKPVLGIVANSKYKHNAAEFVRFLFSLD